MTNQAAFDFCCVVMRYGFEFACDAYNASDEACLEYLKDEAAFRAAELWAKLEKKEVLFFLSEGLEMTFVFGKTKVFAWTESQAQDLQELPLLEGLALYERKLGEGWMTQAQVDEFELEQNYQWCVEQGVSPWHDDGKFF